MRINFTFSVLVLGLLALVGMESCKNDVDVFAPESDVTVIYGLLSADDDVHAIKVNRVFQGESSIEDLAKDPSLSEYENIKVDLLELRDNGFAGIETLNQYSFSEVLITTKDSGYFYYPDQKVYELNQKLNPELLYTVQVDKLDGSDIVESTTPLINVVDDILIKPSGLDFIGLSLASPQDVGGSKEVLPNDKIALEFKVPINTKIMDIYLDFHYQNRDLNGNLGDTITISYNVGTSIVGSIPTQIDDVEKIEMDLNPTAFYSFIAAQVPVVMVGDDILQRQPLDVPLTFRMISGGDEFNTYIEVASPSTSLLETKPDYTNVINGVGLFSTRNFDEKTSLLSNSSVDYLVHGEILAGRKFCNYVNNTDDFPCYQ